MFQFPFFLHPSIWPHMIMDSEKRIVAWTHITDRLAAASPILDLCECQWISHYHHVHEKVYAIMLE